MEEIPRLERTVPPSSSVIAMRSPVLSAVITRTNSVDETSTMLALTSVALEPALALLMRSRMS